LLARISYTDLPSLKQKVFNLTSNFDNYINSMNKFLRLVTFYIIIIARIIIVPNFINFTDFTNWPINFYLSLSWSTKIEVKYPVGVKLKVGVELKVEFNLDKHRILQLETTTILGETGTVKKNRI